MGMSTAAEGSDASGGVARNPEINDEHRGAGKSVQQGASMRELRRRIVIGSAVAVYIAGLGCAVSLSVGRIEAGSSSPSLVAFLPDPLAAHRTEGGR
jgi:hypothetical protein